MWNNYRNTMKYISACGLFTKRLTQIIFIYGIYEIQTVGKDNCRVLLWNWNKKISLDINRCIIDIMWTLFEWDCLLCTSWVRKNDVFNPRTLRLQKNERKANLLRRIFVDATIVHSSFLSIRQALEDKTHFNPCYVRVIYERVFPQVNAIKVSQYFCQLYSLMYVRHWNMVFAILHNIFRVIFINYQHCF